MNTIIILTRYLVVFAVTLALLWAAAPAEFEVAPDTSRDIGLARNCRTADICLLKGPSTSIPELYHGGLWIAHLSVLDGLGLRLGGIRFVSLLAIALSVVMIAALTERMFNPSAGLAAAGLCLYFLSGWQGALNTQWNPTLVPLPAAALFFSTVLAVDTRRPLYYIAAAFCLVLLLQLHPVTMVLLPCAAGIGVAFPPRRHRAATVVAALAVFAASLASLSWDAVVYALSTFGAGAEGHGPPPGPPPPAAAPFWPYLVWSAGCGVLFLLFTRHGRKIRGRAAFAATLALSVGPLLLLVILAAATGRHSTSYYLLFLLPAVTLLPAALIDATWQEVLALRVPWLRARGAAPGLLLLAFVVLSASFSLPGPRRAPPFYSFGEAEAVAAELPDFGIGTFGQAAARIRSPNVFHLLSALQVYLPDPEEEVGSGASVLVVRSATPPPKEMPPGWKALAYADARWLYLAPWPEALDWTKFEVSYRSGETGAEGFRPAVSRLDRTRSEFGYPQHTGLAQPRNWTTFYIRVPIVVPSDGALVLEPYVPNPEQGAAVEVVRVSGLRILEELPAPTATIAPGQAAERGRVKIAWRYPGVYPFPGMVLPFVAEYPPGDDTLPRIIGGLIP